MADTKGRKIFGLSSDEKTKLMATIKARPNTSESTARTSIDQYKYFDKYLSFEEHPDYKQLRIRKAASKQLGIVNPYFLCHDGLAKAETSINGKRFLNFATYDYLDLNGSPEVNAAATEASLRYGTSATASRMASGERPPHRQLEMALADLYMADDCLSYVSGHATNVSTIMQLFGKRDLILHDALAHNSIIMGALASGAKRLAFPNNDIEFLEQLLFKHRTRYERAVIITEGLFSMDGSIPDLPAMVYLKKKYKSFLMVDEAHTLGVLGKTGRGCAEHFSVDPREVDIWMGTLSKTLCGCGGYIAGQKSLIEFLKYTSSGFVYSVGMPPPLAAASKAALDIMLREPQRVQKLQSNSKFFFEYAIGKGLDTGRAYGCGIIPVMLGSSILAGFLSTAMFERGVNALPVLYPAVEEGASRLRFFLSAAHTEKIVTNAIDIVADALPAARKRADAFNR